MNPAIVVQALLDLWDDLPELFGPAWAEIYPQIDENIDRLTKAETLPQQTHLVTELLLLFGRYPVATQRLRRSIQLSEQNLTRLYGRESIDNIPITELHDVVSRLEEHVNPPLEIRYTDITAPIRLPLGQRGVITVGLRCAIVPESVVAQPLRVSPKSIVEVYLHTGTDEVSVDEAVHHLQVEPGRDTAPVVFYIRGLQLGTTTLTLQFAQSGVLVGTIQFVVAIVSETLSEEFLQNLSATLGLGNSYAPPPDLDLRVLTQQRDGGIVLQYVLHSPNGMVGYHYQTFPEQYIPGHSNPQAFQKRLMETIEALGEGRDVGGYKLTSEQAEEKLKGLGRQLYTELFPPALRGAYRLFRTKVHTLQITSDEPWIPWELVRPYDDSDFDAIIDDDFLCMQFAMTRWLAGSQGGAGKIKVKRLACIEVGQAPHLPPLPYARAERDFLSELAAHYGTEDCSPDAATTEYIFELLEKSRPQLLHIASHGNIDLQHANESVVVLIDGTLRASDIQGPLQTRIALDRPLIILNACRVGQQGWSLTQLGGWAGALVGRSRCGAFIGPLWAVNDWLAYEFTSRFYKALCDGKAIGQAARVARHEVRNLAPDNPTWLAYSVYAHPNSRVKFEENSPGGKDST